MSAFWLKYGTGTGQKVRIPMVVRDAVDHATGSDWTPASGDVKISKDGGAPANIATLPTFTNGRWEFVFSDAELQCKQGDVTIIDSATKVVEDSGFNFETYGHASAMYQADLSAANLPANMIQLGSSTQSATDLKDFADTGYDPATHKVAEVTTVGAVSGAVASVTGNVGGNVTGSVGSVVGAVGSVTGNLGGNVNGNVAGSVASVAGAVGSVSGTVGSVAGDVGGKVIGGGAGTITGDGVQAASVTGSVGSVAGAVGSVSGAVGSVTGNVGGNVAGDVQGKVIGGGAGSITGDGVRASAVTGAVGSVTGSVGSVVGAVGSVTAGVTISGTLATLDAIWLKIKAWLRLTLRNDTPIATDHSTELAEINQNMGTGAGTYDPTTDAQQAPVSVTLGPDDIQDIVDGVSQGLSFPTAEDIAAELAGNNVVATFPLLIEGKETVIIQGEDYFDADGNAATVTITATGIETAVTDGWDFVFWGQGDSSGQVVAGSPSSGGANSITVKFDLPAAKTSLVTAGLGGWRVVHKPDATTRRFSEVEGLLRVKPTK